MAGLGGCGLSRCGHTFGQRVAARAERGSRRVAPAEAGLPRRGARRGRGVEAHRDEDLAHRLWFGDDGGSRSEFDDGPSVAAQATTCRLACPPGGSNRVARRRIVPSVL